ncbi:GNAT family N-acetyltransferase [Enterovibrio norvegicus FF-162]|uniref:GNAT family N-acetyltransferase n=2 Tax=Enterovibrio norvegicus TaxID=188144 RepID=UPI0002E578D9|nr:GNAT family N-acetyltransferase [Enterovibrio norvegicus]OEE88986.1 GNAT family N-acetyltransferase [Enterovibrio norvegicus FF-162]
MHGKETATFQQITTESPLYAQALQLRYALFFEMHHLPFETVFDDLEATSQHFAFADHENILAYGRLSALSNGSMKISQMVVAQEVQQQGFGSMLLNRIVEHADHLGTKKIELNARIQAISMYEKAGFISVGNIYLSKSTQVEHIRMVRLLSCK